MNPWTAPGTAMNRHSGRNFQITRVDPANRARQCPGRNRTYVSIYFPAGLHSCRLTRSLGAKDSSSPGPQSIRYGLSPVSAQMTVGNCTCATTCGSAKLSRAKELQPGKREKNVPSRGGGRREGTRKRNGNQQRRFYFSEEWVVVKRTKTSWFLCVESLCLRL